MAQEIENINSHRWCYIGSVIVAVLLVGLRLGAQPSGYLHTWNQITTLVSVDSISDNPLSFYRTRDVVTRVMWEEELEDSDADDRDVRYRCFEEFPLYHMLSALVGSILSRSDVGARLVSIVFWLAGALALWRLGRRFLSEKPLLLALFVYFTSFPFLYYGQALMSDMAMTVCVLWAVVFLDQWTRTESPRTLFQASVFFLLGTLFKSYAVVFVLLLPYAFWKRQRELAQYGHMLKQPIRRGSMLAVVLILPVLGWHGYSYFVPGYHEYTSHSIGAKLDVLLSVELYSAILKMVFRYLGYVPGLLFFLFGFGVFRLCKINALPKQPWWISGWLGVSLLYMLCTLDKLPDHDYYFLLVFPPIILISGVLLDLGAEKLSQRTRAWAGVVFLALVFLVNAGFCAKKFLKATAENPDVRQCSLEVIKHSQPKDFIATLTDVSRYNSLAYYSQRLAINVEGSSFPLSRYIDAGASMLVIDLSPKERQSYETWLKKELLGKRPVWQSRELPDFKNRPRVCEIYRL